MFDGSCRKIHLPQSCFMGKSDMQNFPGIGFQQIAAEGVQSDHVCTGVDLVRMNSFSGAKRTPFRQDGRGIDQAKGGGKDRSQVHNRLVEVQISLMEGPVVVIRPHQILEAARGLGVVVLFEDGHVDETISL